MRNKVTEPHQRGLLPFFFFLFLLIHFFFPFELINKALLELIKRLLPFTSPICTFSSRLTSPIRLALRARSTPLSRAATGPPPPPPTPPTRGRHPTPGAQVFAGRFTRSSSAPSLRRRRAPIRYETTAPLPSPSLLFLPCEADHSDLIRVPTFDSSAGNYCSHVRGPPTSAPPTAACCFHVRGARSLYPATS